MSSFTQSSIEDEVYKFLASFGHGKYTQKIDALTGSNLLIEFNDVFDYKQANESNFDILQLLLYRTKDFIECCEKVIRRIFAEKHGSDKANKLDLTIEID